MPVLADPGYASPLWLPGGDAQTIGPRLFCFIPNLPFMRETVEMEDGDFILIDWLYVSGKKETRAKKLAILSHGLEGDSTRSYMRAAAIALSRLGWDVASRNFRCCGGPMNRLPQLYHSGETGDLAAVINLAEHRGYECISLLGFSMGGNQTLKYVGEIGSGGPPSLSAAAAVSVPCDLTGCSLMLGKPRNRIYMEYFLRTLRRKMRQKHAMYPQLFPLEGLEAIRTFKEFDDKFTAPLGGFLNAEDYWANASSLPHLSKIHRPTLLLNAKNDPFLSQSCYPVNEAMTNPFLSLMIPETGGHVGFPTRWGKTVGWLENTVAAFLEKHSRLQA